MTDPTIISEIDQLTRLLPTCQRCRRLRRKCDTQLPACRLCQKGKAECTFFDHALQQTLPRSYVHSLMTRLGRLRSVQNSANGGTTSSQSAYQPSNHVRHGSTNSVVDGAVNGHKLAPEDISFDKHFVIKNANPTCWQFFGSSSPVALAVEVAVHTRSRFGTVTTDLSYVGEQFSFIKQQCVGIQAPDPRPTPSREEVKGLVDLYLKTTNVLHGYSDDETTSTEIDTYLQHHGPNVRALEGKVAHKFFRVALICAIAAANKSRFHAAYAASSITYYRESLQCIEEVTSDTSLDALQALLLLILYAFVQPRQVDIWKVLDYACRLGVELHLHAETNDVFEDEKAKQRRRSLFWGLYCLERTIGQHFGRPSDLPEEIITAEYPATLNLLHFLENASQYAMVSHYYRLMYLRSEIFRDLYMPARAPDLPRSWYEGQLERILVWQREFLAIERVPGVGSLTCDMGFDTSILYLFQPLLLQALVATKNTNVAPAATKVVPRETYDAAIRTIRLFDTIFRAEEGTPGGDYPWSISSACYIQQSALTIMAHCLLYMDGRLPVVTFSVDPVVSPSTPMDFRDIWQVTDTCLYLLKHVADEFNGMIGMHDLFRNVRDRIISKMFVN